jgi:hypothetical protein
MILASHQPAYLPYLGLFHKMIQCDKFMFMDHLQFEIKLFQNRNYVRSSTGRILLTVPVLTKGRSLQRTDEVMIEGALPWAKKHWLTIFYNYHNAPFFDDHREFFEQVYAKSWRRLMDLNLAITTYLMKCFGIEKEVLFSSQYSLTGQKTALLIDACRETGADTYVSGWGAKSYVDVEEFRRVGLHHRFVRLAHPVYPQRGQPFIPNLSAIDLLFNCGPGSRRILDDAARLSTVEPSDG